MSDNGSTTKTSPDSGVARQSVPGPRGQNTGSPTEDTESLQAHDEAADDFEEVDDDFDDDFSAGIHETSLHTLHSDHSGDEETDSEVHSDEWNDLILDDHTLLAPKPQTGMRQKWVRYLRADGVVDQVNWSQKMRYGFVPRPASSLSERERHFPVERHSRLGEVIQVAGLILCEIPEWKWKKIREHRAKERDKIHAMGKQPVREANIAGQQAGFDPIVVDADKTERVNRRVPRGRR